MSRAGETQSANVAPFLRRLLATGLALVIIGACADRTDEGGFCDTNADCEEACIKFDRPEGSGECGPYAKENTACTRPGFTDHDCEPQLRCTNEGKCVRGAWCPPSLCGNGEVCLSPDDICVFFCTSDAECGSGCCQKLEGRGASICVSRILCEDFAPDGGAPDASDAASEAGS